MESRRKQVRESVTHSLYQANQMMTSIERLVRASTASMPGGETASLRDLVSEALNLRRPEAGRVDLRREDEIPDIQVPADAVRLALHNLVENSIRYADPEKSNPYVRVYCEQETDSDRWLLCVEDNGVGIPRGERKDIFRRFHRGRAARGEGLGLGLSIVREAASKIGGEVKVESAEGVGTTFTFAIPAEHTSADTTAPSQETEE